MAPTIGFVKGDIDAVDGVRGMTGVNASGMSVTVESMEWPVLRETEARVDNDKLCLCPFGAASAKFPRWPRGLVTNGTSLSPSLTGVW